MKKEKGKEEEKQEIIEEEAEQLKKAGHKRREIQSDDKRECLDKVGPYSSARDKEQWQPAALNYTFSVTMYKPF